MQRIFQISLLSFTIAASTVAQSNVDPAHKHAWAENIGWTNWRDAGNPAGAAGAQFGGSFLSGLIWAENVGWINLGDGSPANGVEYANIDAADFGVNVDWGTGELYGYAWGENIGWINFEGGATASPAAPAVMDFCSHTIYGYVWSENVGWINMNNASNYVALGPCAVGDYDCDSDIDLDDHAAMAELLHGPVDVWDCPVLDFDLDGHLDLLDFAEFQSVFTGN